MEGEREREEERLKEDCGGKACGEGRKKAVWERQDRDGKIGGNVD